MIVVLTLNMFCVFEASCVTAYCFQMQEWSSIHRLMLLHHRNYASGYFGASGDVESLVTPPSATTKAK